MLEAIANMFTILMLTEFFAGNNWPGMLIHTVILSTQMTADVIAEKSSRRQRMITILSWRRRSTLVLSDFGVVPQGAARSLHKYVPCSIDVSFQQRPLSSINMVFSLPGHPAVESSNAAREIGSRRAHFPQ